MGVGCATLKLLQQGQASLRQLMEKTVESAEEGTDKRQRAVC